MKIYRQSDREASDWVVVVDGYGADISVIRGHLVIRDGFASEGTLREIYFPRGRCEVERIIVRAPAGAVTFDAIDWCSRMGIAIAFVGSNSRLINCLVPDGPHDGPVKRAQAVSGITDDALRLARFVLARKFESQIHALGVEIPRLGLPSGRDGQLQTATREIENCLRDLPTDSTLDSLLMREGRAAQLYWSVLSGIPLLWPAWALRRVPHHWSTISPRISGGRARVRDARDPFNAIINYCYTLLEVETRIACAAYGLDPDFGILHVDDRLRESFVYDLLEPVRAVVDVLVIEFVRAKGLRPYMFHELRDGVVRLDPDLARSLAVSLMPKMREPIAMEAAIYVAELRRTTVPYRLPRFASRTAPHYRRGRIPPTRPGYCEYCKQPVPKKRLKFCGRHCYLRHSVEVRQPIKLAYVKLAELRANGLSPGHGGEAARKRGIKIAESNRHRAMELTPEERRARRTAQQRVRRMRQRLHTNGALES